MGQTNAAELPQKIFDSIHFPGKKDGKVPPPDSSPSQPPRGRATESEEQLYRYRKDPCLSGPLGPPQMPWGPTPAKPNADTAPMQPEGWETPHGQGAEGEQAINGWAPPVLQQPQMPPMMHPGEAEAELQRKTEQILALAKQIQSIQADLQRLSLPPPPLPTPEEDVAAPATVANAAAVQEARVEQARLKVSQAQELAANVSPSLEDMKDKMAKTLKVARKLNGWFVENAEKMNIQDPTLTPSAYLERLLESAENRMEVLAAGVSQVTAGVRSPASKSLAASPQSQDPPATVVHQPAPPAPYRADSTSQQRQPEVQVQVGGDPYAGYTLPETSYGVPVGEGGGVGCSSGGAAEEAPARAVPPPSTRPRVPAASAEPASQQQNWYQGPLQSAVPAHGGGAMWVRDPDAG